MKSNTGLGDEPRALKSMGGDRQPGEISFVGGVRWKSFGGTDFDLTTPSLGEFRTGEGVLALIWESLREGDLLMEGEEEVARGTAGRYLGRLAVVTGRKSSESSNAVCCELFWLRKLYPV